MAPANFVWRKFEWQCQGDTYWLEVSKAGGEARLSSRSAGENAERQLLVLPMAAWAAVSDAIRQTHVQERRAGLPARAGRSWTLSEHEKVIKAFRDDMPIEEIAKQHSRTPGAIITRLAQAGFR